MTAVDQFIYYAVQPNFEPKQCNHTMQWIRTTVRVGGGGGGGELHAFHRTLQVYVFIRALIFCGIHQCKGLPMMMFRRFPNTAEDSLGVLVIEDNKRDI